MGVLDRIEIIKDKKETKSPEFRPPYKYQIPLSFIPGLGTKTIEKLLDKFETEMNILHKLKLLCTIRYILCKNEEQNKNE